MKSAKEGKNVEFLVEFIISKYGVPSKLFMDNGPSFKFNGVKEFILNIILKKSSLSHITPKVMVKMKPLTRSLRVSYPKLLQNIVKISMSKYLMLFMPIE